ncbi:MULTISPECIES: hypothetical protein [Alteromonadaceae]|uniref:Lipoprotein n=1 Tax=Brumicola blandensis TaxID=3075611 RepID=A0AAW8R200_9ALTE|nr:MULTISPECIES: hypothetical protein [unclassified Alteromonas]MDT0582115.1 hypothetical protein [Alteromonas sp. W409]MDT0627929.1 hypothetical protein [Alteromonas sp. W364]
MKNIVKSLLLGSFLLFLSACENENSVTSNSNANLPAAKINQENLLLIMQSIKDNKKLSEFNIQRDSCIDRNCRRQAKYSFFENAFTEHGFSHIDTFKSYIDLVKSESEFSELFGAWGQIFMPTFECISKDECKAWLINSGKITESEITKMNTQ